jgi:hypothetical protein
MPFDPSPQVPPWERPPPTPASLAPTAAAPTAGTARARRLGRMAEPLTCAQPTTRRTAAAAAAAEEPPPLKAKAAAVVGSGRSGAAFGSSVHLGLPAAGRKGTAAQPGGRGLRARLSADGARLVGCVRPVRFTLGRIRFRCRLIRGGRAFFYAAAVARCRRCVPCRARRSPQPAQTHRRRARRARRSRGTALAPTAVDGWCGAHQQSETSQTEHTNSNAEQSNQTANKQANKLLGAEPPCLVRRS